MKEGLSQIFEDVVREDMALKEKVRGMNEKQLKKVVLAILNGEAIVETIQKVWGFFWRYETMFNDIKHEQFVARQFMSYYEKNHLDPEEKAMVALDIELLM